VYDQDTTGHAPAATMDALSGSFCTFEDGSRKDASDQSQLFHRAAQNILWREGRVSVDEIFAVPRLGIPNTHPETPDTNVTNSIVSRALHAKPKFRPHGPPQYDEDVGDDGMFWVGHA
jgi:hypothetical protein